MKAALQMLARHHYLHELVTSTIAGLAVYALCVLIVLIAERSAGRGVAVYRTPNALNDIAYAVFYKCSIYNVLAFPLFAVVIPRLQFLRIDLMKRVPEIVALIVCWLVFDFLNYWMHRLQHGVGALWAFHSVHHLQTRLTFVSANRIHAVEQLYVGLLMLIPAFILGIPQSRWLPLLLVQVFSETIQHARLNWTFGPLRHVFVSPAAHALHHSTDASEYNANFGRVLSLWDVLFGTWKFAENRNRRYGVEGMYVAESLIAQFVHPFRLLASKRRAAAAETHSVPGLTSSPAILVHDDVGGAGQ